MKYQHDYKPGWTYLSGQQKPAALREALQAQDDAWEAYTSLVEELANTGYNDDDMIRLGKLLDFARHADVEVGKQYKIWHDLNNAVK